MERELKTRPEQCSVMIDFLEEHPELVTNKFMGHAADGASQNKKWEILANRLNGMGYGKKSVVKWKEALSRWKSKTKSKAALLKKEIKSTGGGEMTTRALTDIEERLLVLMGTRSVEGDGIDELGDLATANGEPAATAETFTASPLSARLASRTFAVVSDPPPLCPLSRCSGDVVASLSQVTAPVASTPFLSDTEEHNMDLSDTPSNQQQASTSLSRKRCSRETSGQAPPTQRRVVTSTPQTRRYTTLTHMQRETMGVLNSIDKSLKSIAEDNKRMTDVVVNYVNRVLQLNDTDDDESL